MHPRDLLIDYREGRLDEATAQRTFLEMEDPSTAIGRVVASDRILTEWLLDEPPWIATPRRVAGWLLHHGLCWGLCILAFWGSWQQWAFVLLGAHEVIHAIARRRVPKGTVYEGVVGLLYGAILGLLFEAIVSLVTPIMPTTIPTIFCAVGLWAGLGAGFGLRRRLLFGEVFWSEVGAQVLFAYVALVPVVIALLAGSQFIGKETRLGNLLFDIGQIGLLIGGLVAGVMPRKVEMGFRDAFSVVGEGLGGAAMAVFGGWFAIGLFGQHLSPKSAWLDQWFSWNTLLSLFVYVGVGCVWLDVCRGISSSRGAWEKTILPRYERIGDFFIHSALVLIAANIVLDLIVQGDYLTYSADRGLGWLNVILVGMSVFIAWRFRDVLSRLLTTSVFARLRQSATEAVTGSVAGPLFAFRLFAATIRDTAVWITTFAFGISRTAAVTS